MCVELTCVEASSVPNPEKEKEERRKKNWIGIEFSPDVSIVGSARDACSQAAQSDGKLSCFYAGGQQVQENPLLDPGKLNGGVAMGSMRVMLSYDRVIGKRMTIGARAGFAFLGPPKRVDGKTFLPLHLEARFAFHLRKDPFIDKGVRPYVFVNAGLAESAARVTTSIAVDTPAKPNGEVRNVDVYQKGGVAFAGAGVGIQYAVAPRAALVVEVAGREMFPRTATVIAPALGFAYGL